jgi:hypothetical protein
VLIVSAAIAGCFLSANPNVTLEEDPGLARHCIYRPTDLDSVVGKLPIVVWGAGGCITMGGYYTEFLSEIASHNYVVIASNNINELGMSTPQMLIDAIDWIIAENSRVGSKYYHKIDTTKIAAMGHSCGGLEALHAGATDSRITTVVAWDSGIFDYGTLGGATKDDLTTLHGPTMWVNAGPKDVAYAQAEKDYAEVPDYVPSVWANYDLSEKGSSVLGAHYGTFNDSTGGEYGRVAVLWLDFTLKDVQANRDQFVGTDCILNSVPKWSVQSKNWG